MKIDDEDIEDCVEEEKEDEAKELPEKSTGLPETIRRRTRSKNLIAARKLILMNHYTNSAKDQLIVKEPEIKSLNQLEENECDTNKNEPEIIKKDGDIQFMSEETNMNPHLINQQKNDGVNQNIGGENKALNPNGSSLQLTESVRFDKKELRKDLFDYGFESFMIFDHYYPHNNWPLVLGKLTKKLISKRTIYRKKR